MGSRRSSKVRTVVLVFLVALFVLLMVILGLALFIVSRRDTLCQSTVVSGPLNPVTAFLKSLNVTDGLEIAWYHDTGSRDQLEESLKENMYHMFITTVSIRHESGSDVVYAGSSGAGLFRLSDWLDTVFSYSWKGALIELQTDDQVEQVLTLLQSRKNQAKQSIWFKLKVSSTDGESNTPVDFENFAEKVAVLYPDAQVSVEWVSDSCCEEGYNKTVVRQMWTRLQRLSQPINVVVSANVVDNSWSNLKWLLDRSTNITMTVTTGANSEACPSFDLLNVRNDFIKTRIFFDIGQGGCLSEFKKLAHTAGSALHHFDVDLDASRITWGHGVNSQEKLKKALRKGVMFLEADILLRGQGTDTQTDIPVMAHDPPATDSDITLSEWLDIVAQTDRGMKLDFKSIESVIPSLRILNSKRELLHQPVWLNSDVLLGPNTNKVPVNATAFLQAVNEYFPEATLSLGWTTGWTNTAADVGYSEEMVRAMNDLCQTLSQPVTFPVRAAAAKRSWCQLQWLVEQSHRYSITVWSGSRDVMQQDEMNYVRRHSQKSKVYFDVPGHLMPDV